MAVEGEEITEPAKPLNTVSLGPGGPPSSTVAWKPSLGWELGHLQGPSHLLPSLSHDGSCLARVWKLLFPILMYV